ncbi:hypothetical protein BFP77_11300 [Maribacter sp. 4U21]|uniref:hypothetical protein n=1 Tax=Maribacter sp. 4U21 TaxID=1889779 RepID=UPI000C151E1F|nr:hypothetical protein [Maribacter sp. 4U21]PIB27707.1 hypothetical protein BFP77_11300 [Maribacter sp. 4U21]
MKWNLLFRRKTFLFFTLWAVGAYMLLGQNLSVNAKIKPAFKDYFGLPRVSVFLHLNKSAFVKGEHIWFKGYLYNRLKQTPFKEPVNLYVGIYNSNGDQVTKELFISEEGFSKGQILIDSTFAGGQYYIKATTSWMRNFKEDDSFVQQFTVVDDQLPETNDYQSPILDIQLLPEGGHLVSGVQGTVGVKVLNRFGYGVQGLDGYIKNRLGDSIASFRTNRFGLAKFQFLPDKNEDYYCYIKNSDGNELSFTLPNIADIGIVMSVKRVAQNRIMILLGTNSFTKNKIGNKPYSLLFHRDGLLKNIEVNFPFGESYISYILDSKGLHRGMNIITLIDNEGRPIAERLVFNSEGIKQGELSVSLNTTKEDSVKITLNELVNTGSLQFLSASVLPVGTQAYQQRKNILNSFLLSPYVNGFIEHPSYYFTDMTMVKEEELDLLLITQGWSRYNWDNLFNNPPEKKYSFKTGVDLMGKLNFELPKKYDLMLYPGKNTGSRMIDLKQGQDSFDIKNFYLEKGTELKLTALGPNGKLLRPNLYIRVDDGITTDKIYDLRRKNHKLFYNMELDDYRLENFITPDNTIALEEVIVTERKERKRFTNPQISEDKLTEVTTETEANFPQLLDLIRSNGFNVWEMPNTGYDRIRITTKRVMSFSLTQPSPILYVDDVYYSDFNILQDFSTKKIASYYIDRSGNGEPGGAGGIIRVYTRGDGDLGAAGSYEAIADPNFFVHKLQNGFSPVKDFYVPKYASVSDDSFRNFGTVHWEPNISVNESGKAHFGFNNLGWKEFEIFIEGMGADGTLYSQRELISVR